MVKITYTNVQIYLRKVFLLICDILSIFLSNYFALLLRFELDFSSIDEEYLININKYLMITIILTIMIFYFNRLYSSLWTYAGATEMVNIAVSSLLAVVLQMFISIYFKINMPRTYYCAYPVVLFMLLCVSRFSYRALRGFSNRRIDSENHVRVMIIGAGAAGNSLIKEIIGSRYIKKKVVCVIDDNNEKKGNYIHGIRIIGNRSMILEAVKTYQVDEIIIAMPSAESNHIKDILDICKKSGCELRKVPGIYQFVNGDISVSELKEVDVNDLLGREPIKVDMSSIMDYVSGKTILVTGGGGSIGSELCRQIAAHKPGLLIIFDIYENSAYSIQNELMDTYQQLNLLVLIGSIRNTNRMDSIFAKYRPDIVYHAAAHKHVPLMETSPNEAVKNNVMGTWNTVRAADKYEVEKFVMISTDKAVNPTNVMGATKRMCEMIIQTYNNRSKTEFVAVRFGNVLGSNGSVIPLFKNQIKNGGPVTITHPDIIRFFMTIPEAVSLVLQAGAYAKGGEIFILDMGEPVKILDLAKNLILLSGHKPNEDIQIEYTGLRPGEKLYEEILMEEEGMLNTANKLIFIGKPLDINEEVFFSQLKELKDYVNQEPDDIREFIREIVPTYKNQSVD